MLTTSPKSTKAAFKLIENPNLVLISVPGQYASYEANTALDQGCNAMIFSNNVSLDEESALKKKAVGEGLLLMGPDAAGAVINGKSVFLASEVNRGGIGIVSASGSGVQPLSAIIDRDSLGVSQAVETGPRDLSAAVGGVMSEAALKALADDPNTKVIIVISRPPNKIAADKLIECMGRVKKQFVINFQGYTPESEMPKNIVYARTTEEAALYACALYRRERLELVHLKIEKNERSFAKYIDEESNKIQPGAKYIRALYSCGSSAGEAVFMLKEAGNEVYSNSKGAKTLVDVSKSACNTVLDLSDGEITKDSPHPAIDYSLRCERMMKEAGDEDTAVILFDIVLGRCACNDPAAAIVPAVGKAKGLVNSRYRHVSFIAYVSGTDKDPQGFADTVKALSQAGVIVAPTNAAAVKLASQITQKLKMKRPILRV